MNQLLYVFSFLHLTLCSLGAIEDFPTETLKNNLAITTVPIKIAEMNAQSIVPFQDDFVNRNHYYNDRNGNSVQFIILNYTHSDFLKTMDIFTKDIPDKRVSAHYVITQPEPEKGIKEGLLYQVVPEDKTAWFTGISFWNNLQNLNNRSIGISLINRGFEEDSRDYSRQWFNFDKQQIDVLGKICMYLIQRYNIPAHQVLGRGDVAPYRTEGPGILFPWEYLYTTYGVGAWLTPQELDEKYIVNTFNPQKSLPTKVDQTFFLECLKNLGYNVKDIKNDEDIKNIIKIFKSHFSCNQSPDQYNSTLDANDMLWAWGLEAKYKPNLISKL